MITANLRHQLIVADRTRDIDVIAAIIDAMLAENDDLSPLEVEMALRDAAAQSYLVFVNGRLAVVLGMVAWLTALAQEGITAEENRSALGNMVPAGT